MKSIRLKTRSSAGGVAIKVPPEEFAKDSDRVSLFQREAKLLASINHPNIAAIYGLEESGGTNFLVLEMAEGETLADRNRAGAIPVEEALKPANIKIYSPVRVFDNNLYADAQLPSRLASAPHISRRL